MFSLRLVHFEPQLLFLDISYFGFSDLYAPGKITVVEFFILQINFKCFLLLLICLDLLDQTTNFENAILNYM